MTKRELIDLLNSRTDIPDDTEIRCTLSRDVGATFNVPASILDYTEIGPIRYLEITNAMVLR